MSSVYNVDFGNSQSIQHLLDLDANALAEQAAGMSNADAEALFNAFDSMVTNANKLDGDVIFKGHTLSRVNYGTSFKFGNRGHVATEEESTKARTLFKAALLKYIDMKPELGRKDELRDMVDNLFSNGQKSKSLSRRTISQAVNIVKDARTDNAGGAGPAKNAMIGRALGGTWTKGVQWKLIGGSLGVKMTRSHLETMLSEALSIAKTKVEGLSKAGASALADGLKAQMNRYLKLFDANKLGGALERLVINGLDKESVAGEMLRQLEKDSIPQMLGKGVKRDGTKSLGVVSDVMRNKLIALKNAEDTIGSKAILDRIHVAAGDGAAQSVEQRQRNLLGDLLLNANTMDAVYYMNDGERLLARLTEDAELFSSMCKAAAGKDDDKGGRAMLDALGNVSANLKQEFTKLFAAVGKLVNPKNNAAQPPLEFKSMLFAKLDSVYKAFRTANIEQKITDALRQTLGQNTGDVAEKVVNQIRNVCTNKVSETDLQIIKELITKADDISLRRMFAASFREGQGGIDGGFSPAAFVRGMGVYANKLLQGLPLKPETDIKGEADRAMYDAVSRARNDLPKIDTSILEAELYATLSAEDSQIQSVSVENWLGAGSVAQTGLCKVIYKQQDGQNLVNDGGVDVVLKVLRPDIKEVFSHEAKIVRDLIGQSGNDVNLVGQHHKRVTSFNEECVTKKELVNALRGIKQFGVPYARRGDDDGMRQLKMPWKVNGTTIEFSENNLVGSENLVLKAGKTVQQLKAALDKLDAAAGDDAYGAIVDDFFLGATDTFFVIERAPGQDLAKFNATFKVEVSDNNCGLGNLKPEEDRRPAEEKIQIVKQSRDTIQTLNRALTQLKSTFLKNALHTKGHFFHCDLTAGNVVFDKKTGSLTIIDYGKTGRLSDDEALAMLKLENLELHIKDGVQNGKKMREAYQTLLKSEITRLEDKIDGYAQNPYDADEHTLDQQALEQLKATQTKLNDKTTAANIDYLFQKAFVRLDENARKENPPQVKTSFELFADVLKDVSASFGDLDLPLPSVVRDFIDTYSRLQNGINDAQNNLNALNAKISEIIYGQHDTQENRTAFNELIDLKLEHLGWLDADVGQQGGTTTVTLKAGSLGEYLGKMNFGAESFTSRLTSLEKQLRSKDLSLEERQSKLNAVKVLIGNERTRLQNTVDIIRGQGGVDYSAITEKIRTSLGLDQNAITFNVNAQDGGKGLTDAIAKLNAIEKTVTEEINLVSTSFASDSMFSTSVVAGDKSQATENRMLAAGHFNTADTNIRRTSVTLADMTAFRAAKAHNGIQNDHAARNTPLSPDLRQRFRELLLTSGCCDWKQTMTFLANDKACTFFEYGKLLETCTTRMDTLKGKVDFSAGGAYDPEAKLDLSPLTMKITDPDDKDFFAKLFELNASKGVQVSGNGKVKDILTSFGQLRESIIPSLKNIDLTQLGEIELESRGRSKGPEEIIRDLKKVFHSAANSDNQLVVAPHTRGDNPISRAIAKNYGNELTVTAIKDAMGSAFGQDAIIDNPADVEKYKNDPAYVPCRFNNNIDLSSIRNALGIAVIALPKIQQDFDVRYQILKKHLQDDSLDPVLKQKYQAFAEEIDGVYQNDKAYDPKTGKFDNKFERPNSPKRHMEGRSWVYDDGDMVPNSLSYKPEVMLDMQYGSVLRSHVTVLDYYRITALISEAKTDELKLDEQGVKTYEMLQEQLKKLSGGQMNAKDASEATFGDLGELMDRVKAGYVLKYNPLGEQDFENYKAFYESIHNGKKFEGAYIPECQCKQELNEYVTGKMGDVLKQNQYDEIDYGEGVIDEYQVKEDYLALVEGAKNLKIPGYRTDEELEKNENLSYYWQSKSEDQNFVGRLCNKEYIKVAGDVEQALKKQPRLNDNRALVNADLDNNADFKFNGNVEYKKFDQDDVLYMSFAPVKTEDVSNKPLQQEDGNTVVFFETGIKANKKADYANNRLNVAQMNDLKLSRHLYDKSITLSKDKKSTLADLNTNYENLVVGKEKEVLLGYIDRAVEMLFELDNGGNYEKKGPYFDSVRNFLREKVKNLSNAVNAVKESKRKVIDFIEHYKGGDYTKDEAYDELVTKFNSAFSWVSDHCRRELKAEGGVETLLRYLRDPGAVEKDRADKGKDFNEPNLSLLPVLQELVLRLDVQNLPPQG